MTWYPKENVTTGRRLERLAGQAMTEAINDFECKHKLAVPYQQNTGNKAGFDGYLGPIAVEFKNCKKHYPIFKSWVEKMYESKVRALGYVPSKLYLISSGNYQPDAKAYMREHNIVLIEIP